MRDGRNMNNIKIFDYTDNESKNALVTIAIGKNYLENWEKNALPTWKLYAQRHKLQIIVVASNLIKESDPFWKKPQWQKLLLPNALTKFRPEVENICYLDTDILINPTAPNIFDQISVGKIGSVSLRKNLPFDREKVYKKLALLRKTYVDNSYPLDSALFISLEHLYEFHGLPIQNDEFCTGVLLFDIASFSEVMKEWFYEYSNSVKSITNNGEQTHLNYHVLNGGYYNQLNYKWQSIWSYEVAWKYPFLFKPEFKDHILVQECMKNLLFENYFLHFASSWSEANAWTTNTINITPEDMSFYEDYSKLINKKNSGVPVGYIVPPVI
jgi:hypothetical protein